MKEPSKEQIKDRAKHLRHILREKHQIELPHGHALEVISKIFGFNDWNTASALSSSPKNVNQEADKNVLDKDIDLPYATKFQTAGELADFFAKFDRNTKVVVNEYEKQDKQHFETSTSVCSLTYDKEIQTSAELRLELNTEEERYLSLHDFGQSSNQTFDDTKAGRLQRRIKFLFMQSDFWGRTTKSMT